MLTKEDIAMVTEDWTRVAAIQEETARLFYGRLFEIAPEVRPLFKSNIDEQGKKLMQVLGVAVNSLSNLGAIVPTVQALGKRHVGYGVTEQHYATVGSALLWTLEQGLGAAFTPDHREAWTRVYTTLSEVMITAAREVAA